MSGSQQHILRYHHGGTLVREGDIKYMDGQVDEFGIVDPDKLCLWDLLGDVQKLGYDITKAHDFLYVNGEGTLKAVSDDVGVVVLADQLREKMIVDIYVESTGVCHEKELPEVLAPTSQEKSMPEVLPTGPAHDQVQPEILNDSASQSSDDEESLVQMPFADYNSDEDVETEEARNNVKKFIELKKSLEQNDLIDVDEAPTGQESDESDESYHGLDGANDRPGHKYGKVTGYESEYISSSDPGSYEDTSDGSDAEDAQRHSSVRKLYDQDVPLEDFSLDLRFKDLKAFKKELVEFSTKRGFEFRYIKNDKLRVRAVCVGKNCKWLILCSWCSGRKIFTVKHYVPQHTCLLGVTKNRRVTAPVVAKRFGEVIAAMPFIRARQLRVMVRRELGVFVTNKVCRNAKGLVIKKIEQQFWEDFRVLNSYALELKVTNPGSNVTVISERINPADLPTFQKMYICLTALREGFLGGCRRIIGLDGCFLKGLLKGQILVAVGRDGNNQMFPIAWAVVQKETTESWTWFIEHLKVDLCIGDGLGWSLISGMQKGLIHAVNNLLPLIEHRMCARHIYARWGKKHQGKELQLAFWKVARSTSQPEMQKNLEQMDKINGGQGAVKELLEKWPITGWCQAFFSDIVKCDVIDNNMCETFNGVVLEARSKPIIHMLEDIRQYLMTRIAVKRDYAAKWGCDCGPNIVSKIEKERKKSGKWLVEWNGGDKHEVYWDNLNLNVREAYMVMLAEHVCSCGKWSKSGIPCQHAMASIAFNGGDPLQYISEWLRKDKYLEAYQYLVNPVKGREFWPSSEEGSLLPPIVKRMPGRPAKKRKREALEGKNKGKTKLSRAGRAFKCGICFGEGHNRLTCPKRSKATESTGDVTNDQIPTTDPIECVSVGQTSHKGKVAPKERAKKAAAAPKGKKKLHVSSQGPLKMSKESTGDVHIDAIPTIESIESVSVSQTRNKGKATPKDKAKKVVAAPKGKKPASTKGPVITFKGQHTGGLIIGREVHHSTSFITAQELLARRNDMASAVERMQKQNENEPSQHTTSELGPPEISTQQSMTSVVVQENPKNLKMKIS